MKKVKGAALIWSLAVLIVLAVITLTGVGLAVSYYRSCMKRAGDNQADYNSEAAAELLRDQLESRFGNKQIYFTYRGNVMLDVSDPERIITVTGGDRDYFGAAVASGSEDERYFCAVRKLESRLMADYLKNRGGSRVPVRLTFNYGNIDASASGHGYYGNSADLVIDSIERIDDNGSVYYAAVVKAEAQVNSGHTASTGIRFVSRPVRFGAENIPTVACSTLRVGISPETEIITDPETFDDVEALKYRYADGIVLGLLQGADTGVPFAAGVDSNIAGVYGGISTDGYAEGTAMRNEISYLDPDTFTVADCSSGQVFGRYAALHGETSAEYDADFPLWRNRDAHTFGADRIYNGGSLNGMKAYYELPRAIVSGSSANNRVKRYYVVSGNEDAVSFTVNGGKEYSMGFAQYAAYAKEHSGPPEDSGFTDRYGSDRLICCRVEKRDSDDEISLDNIMLEDGMTYFFHIRQNTRVSFDTRCEGVSADVYFMVDGKQDRGAELKLVNPPQSVNIFAFDSSAPDGRSSYESGLGPSGGSSGDVTIIVKDTDSFTVPEDYTVSGWFSCGTFSVFDETLRSEEYVNSLAAGEKLTPKKVMLRAVRPREFVTIFDDISSAGSQKSYKWVFDRFVRVDDNTA